MICFDHLDVAKPLVSRGSPSRDHRFYCHIAIGRLRLGMHAMVLLSQHLCACVRCRYWLINIIVRPGRVAQPHAGRPSRPGTDGNDSASSGRPTAWDIKVIKNGTSWILDVGISCPGSQRLRRRLHLLAASPTTSLAAICGTHSGGRHYIAGDKAGACKTASCFVFVVILSLLWLRWRRRGHCRNCRCCVASVLRSWMLRCWVV